LGVTFKGKGNSKRKILSRNWKKAVIMAKTKKAVNAFKLMA
jgi:hypothetical protein